MTVALALALTLAAAPPRGKAATPTPAKAPAAPAWSGPDSAVATSEKPEARLGEPFAVTITVKHSAGERWALAPKQELRPFVLVGQSAESEAAGGREVTKLTLRLALFELGAHAVPDLQLLATDAAGATHDFPLPGPEVQGVAPDLKKDDKRRDIAPPVPFYVRTLRLVWIALGALAGLALLAFAIRWWRRRPKRAKGAPAAPPRPEHEVALEALAHLEAEGLPGQGRFKEFHLRLSEALRAYLQARYGIYALDMTSAELLERLGRLPTDGLRLADVSWVCAQGDLAKFAKGQPSADDCKQALELVRQTVQRTRRAAVAPGDAPGVAA
ncbi:MAG: hypothetical protein ACYCWW_06435 [Deltaproteobacteria bacterium]